MENNINNKIPEWAEFMVLMIVNRTGRCEEHYADEGVLSSFKWINGRDMEILNIRKIK